jgi:hypothetical protein
VAKNSFLLSALCHLKAIFAASLADLKASKKPAETRARSGGVTSLPPWKKRLPAAAEKLSSDFGPSKVKLAAKKIDFYLSWASECYSEYELLYN